MFCTTQIAGCCSHLCRQMLPLANDVTCVLATLTDCAKTSCKLPISQSYQTPIARPLTAPVPVYRLGLSPASVLRNRILCTSGYFIRDDGTCVARTDCIFTYGVPRQAYFWTPESLNTVRVEPALAKSRRRTQTCARANQLDGHRALPGAGHAAVLNQVAMGHNSA